MVETLTLEREEQDRYWMHHALSLARRAEQVGEVPVGACLVKDGQLIAEGWNQPIGNVDPTAHAEIIAIRAASQRLDNYRLLDTSLYVTLEPCAMCAGAIIHARIARLVYAATDPRAGAAGSVVDLFSNKAFNHRVSVEGGLESDESAQMLKAFFRKRR